MASGPVVCSAFVESGHLTVRNRHFLETALAALRDGEYELEIRRKRATRSLNQNAFYWGVVVHMLSEHTGYTPDEIHEVLKAKFIPKRLALADGNGEIKGEFVIGGTTTRLDTIEFSEYCKNIQQWAAEDLDLYIPDPNEA